MGTGKTTTETPNHVVLHRARGYEVWRYPSSVLAVVYAKDLRRSNGSGPSGSEFRSVAFGILARYIGVFGRPENTSRASSQPEKVAMTAPVVSTRAPEKVDMTAPVVMRDAADAMGESTAFLLPAKYRSTEEAPVPTNPAVKLQMAEGGRVEAVLALTGHYTMNTASACAADLSKMLKRDGVKPVGEWSLQAYNPPFTPPHLKRNEIHFPLDPTRYL